MKMSISICVRAACREPVYMRKAAQVWCNMAYHEFYNRRQKRGAGGAAEKKPIDKLYILDGCQDGVMTIRREAKRQDCLCCKYVAKIA